MTGGLCTKFKGVIDCFIVLNMPALKSKKGDASNSSSFTKTSTSTVVPH